MSQILCFRDTRRAILSLAKTNVLRYFAVVGILEDRPGFLFLLEKKIPSFFKGIQSLYKPGVFSIAYDAFNAVLMCKLIKDTFAHQSVYVLTIKLIPL